MRFLGMIAVALLQVGCTDLKSEFQSPDVELPDRYLYAAPVMAPSREDVEWWRNFQDPVLDQLIEQGLSGNLSVAQAHARLQEASADARGAGVALSGSTSGNYSAATGRGDRFDMGISAEINLAGESRYRANAARNRLEAARFNEVEARRTVLSEVAQTYVDLRFFQISHAFKTLDLASRHRTLRDIKTQIEAGGATRLDLLRAQSLLAETHGAIPQYEASIVQQRNRLSTLLGVPVGSLPLDLGYQGKQPVPVRVADVGVPADLLRARPDIRRAEELYAAALSDVGSAKAARYPRLRLSGLISAPLSGGASSDSLIAGLVVPIFDQPALAAEVDASEARVQQAFLQWRIAVLNAVEEVENAQVVLRTSLAARDAARDQVSLDRKSLALSRDLVAQGGGITVLDVLDRERTLSASRAALAQNTREVGRSYIALRVALGRGHPLLADTPTDSGNEDVTKLGAVDDED